ncbi:MAG: DsbA family protein, partial [Candidatus Methylomirabilales bacterium]
MRRLQERYPDSVQLRRWSFALRPEPDPTATFHGTYREAAWRQASSLSADVGIAFRMWTRPDFPEWSLPALEAAKCAELQGPEVFERMHLDLFKAFFEEGSNIGEPAEVIEVARQAGLDMDSFLRDYEQGSQRPRILEEHRQAVAQYGVRAIPTVIIGEAPPIVGAVPLQEYER